MLRGFGAVWMQTLLTAVFVIVTTGAFAAGPRPPLALVATRNPLAIDAPPSVDGSFAGLRWGYVVPQTTDVTCGPSALATLLNAAYGTGWTEAELDAMTRTASGTATLASLLRTAEALGLGAAAVRSTWPQLTAYLDETGHPALVRLLRPVPHFTVIAWAGDGHAFLLDPSVGQVALPAAHFVDVWDGTALLMAPAAPGSFGGMEPLELVEAARGRVRRLIATGRGSAVLASQAGPTAAQSGSSAPTQPPSYQATESLQRLRLSRVGRSAWHSSVTYGRHERVEATSGGLRIADVRTVELRPRWSVRLDGARLLSIDTRLMHVDERIRYSDGSTRSGSHWSAGPLSLSVTHEGLPAAAGTSHGVELASGFVGGGIEPTVWVRSWQILDPLVGYVEGRWTGTEHPGGAFGLTWGMGFAANPWVTLQAAFDQEWERWAYRTTWRLEARRVLSGSRQVGLHVVWGPHGASAPQWGFSWGVEM